MISIDQSIANELLTIRDFIRFSVSCFEASEIFCGHGTQNTYDEAVWLILGALQLPHDSLNNFLDARLTLKERHQLVSLIHRRTNDRVPTAYLINEAWLGEYKFYVDERVIVPRSFIAELLREQLYPWVENPEAIEHAADICTGSGCLAILLADAFPNAFIDAVDLSTKALEVATINVNDYELESQIQLIQSDLLVELKDKKYDLIISNPPYVNAPSMQSLPEEYHREPEIALASGSDGLDHVRTLLDQAKHHLTENGLLIVEIGHNREALEIAFPRLPFIWLEVSAGDQFVFLLRKSDFL